MAARSSAEIVTQAEIQAAAAFPTSIHPMYGTGMSTPQPGPGEPRRSAVMNFMTDYAQIEARIFASLGVPAPLLNNGLSSTGRTAEPGWTTFPEVLRRGIRGRNSHALMIDDASYWPPRPPREDLRRRGMMANFGLLYGTNPLVGPAIDLHAEYPISAIRRESHPMLAVGRRSGMTHLSAVLELRYLNQSPPNESAVDQLRREIQEDVDRDILRILSRNSIQEAEDHQAFAALDRAARVGPSPGDPNWAAEITFSEAPGMAIFNPRAIERFSHGIPLAPTTRINMEEIRTRRFGLSMPSYGTNPCGEILLSPFSAPFGPQWGPVTVPPIPPPKPMDLEGMKKIAIMVRPTAWQKVMKDEDPF